MGPALRGHVLTAELEKRLSGQRMIADEE